MRTKLGSQWKIAEKSVPPTAINLCRGIFIAIAIGCVWASPASAVPINSTTDAMLAFDFSTVSAQPPYININFQLDFGLDDDFVPGDVFTIQAFATNGTPASNPLTISAVSSAGGEIESGFGGPIDKFLGLNSPTGYLEITNVVGSFDLTGGQVLAANGGLPQDGTGWVAASLSAQTVPEPSTFALTVPFMIVFGIGNLGRLRRIGHGVRLSPTAASQVASPAERR